MTMSAPFAAAALSVDILMPCSLALRSLVSGWRVVATTCSAWTTFASSRALMSVSPSLPAPMTAIRLRASIQPPHRMKGGDGSKCARRGARGRPVGYPPPVGDSVFEYGGVSADRLAAWEDVLKDVAFPRGDDPGRGKPGHEEYQRRATQALEQLWTHLALLPRLVDETHPHVAAYLTSIRKTVEREAPPPPRRRWMDAGLDLSHVMNTQEALLLGLIGPKGQSPHAPCSAEPPPPPSSPAWLALGAGSAELLPGPAARRTVSWRRERAVI